MAKETIKKAVTKTTIKKPRTPKKMASVATENGAPQAEATTASTTIAATTAKRIAEKPSNAVMVYDHVAKVERKMSKRQFDILSTTTYTEGRSKFKRYTLGNVKKAAITKND